MRGWAGEHGLVGVLRSLSRLVEPLPLCVDLPEDLPTLPTAAEAGRMMRLFDQRPATPQSPLPELSASERRVLQL